MTSNRYEVKGINDDKDFCECCGKNGLKRVVWIEDRETGEIRHFGTSCAVKPAKGFNLDREIKRSIREYEDREKSLYSMASYAYRKAGGRYNPDGTGYGWNVADADLYAACLRDARVKRAESDAWWAAHTQSVEIPCVTD